MITGGLRTAHTWAISRAGSAVGTMARQVSAPGGSGPSLPGPIVGGWVACQTGGVPPHRDVAAFDERAAGYEQGWRGRLHHDIADRAAELAVSVHASPRRVLDAGCGTGYLLRVLAGRCPQAAELAGIDPAPSMIEAAEQAASDRRLRFTAGAAEALPCPDDTFDLVVSTTSFDHWADQRAGLGECARVLAPGGHLVLADLFSPLLLPTLLAGRRAKDRTRQRASRLLRTAGFQDLAWHDLYTLIIKAVTGRRCRTRRHPVVAMLIGGAARRPRHVANLLEHHVMAAQEILGGGKWPSLCSVPVRPVM
jgi:ubiquinone/menaquinone biosynthesis C-methylase UbiE